MTNLNELRELNITELDGVAGAGAPLVVLALLGGAVVNALAGKVVAVNSASTWLGAS